MEIFQEGNILVQIKRTVGGLKFVYAGLIVYCYLHVKRRSV